MAKRKFLDLPKLIIRIWIILWIILFIFIFAKLIFNVWYPIVTENERYKNICLFIDNNKYVRYIFLYLFYSFNFSIWFMIVTSKNKMKIVECIIVELTILSIYIVKIFSNTIGALLELVLLIILPIIINLKKDSFKSNLINILFPLIIYILFNGFQIGMSYIRGINKLLSDMPTFMITLIQIDYYIFTIITWMGVCFMGLIAPGWFWAQSKTKLLALREKELKKECPNEERLSIIAKVLKNKYGMAEI